MAITFQFDPRDYDALIRRAHELVTSGHPRAVEIAREIEAARQNDESIRRIARDRIERVAQRYAAATDPAAVRSALLEVLELGLTPADLEAPAEPDNQVDAVDGQPKRGRKS